MCADRAKMKLFVKATELNHTNIINKYIKDNAN